MTFTLPSAGRVPAATDYPPAVPTLLAFVAGYVDATTFLAFSGLFVAQATGSLVVAGATIDGDAASLVKVAAIPTFFLAGMGTTAVVRSFRADKLDALAISLVIEAILIGGLLLSAIMIPGDATIGPLFGLAAMGVQSASARLLLSGYGSTNVMTSNITQFSIDIEDTLAGLLRGRPVAEPLAGAFRVGMLIFAFLFGVVAGAVGYRVSGLLGLALMMATLLGIASWAISANPLYRRAEDRHGR